jgi:cell division protease FtsH
MITEYGMSEKFATMQFGKTQGQVFLGRDLGHEQNYSDQIAYEIDTEMQELIRSCYDQAKQMLTERREQLNLLAETLLTRETLDEEQIKQLLETGKIDDSVVVTIQGKDDEVVKEEPKVEEIKPPDTNLEKPKTDQTNLDKSNEEEPPKKDL